jgi:branched-chain amino acid transport system substrate-binding protein
LRAYKRAGYAGVVAVAAAALAVAGCSSSSSSSSSSATTPATTAASSPATSPTPSATGSGQGGLGTASVTNYLSYTGGTAGPANSSLTPVTVGWLNEQGDANPPGLLATNGAQMAVSYINKELGGVDGHPLKLDTCFTTTEEQGTACAQQFLANKAISVIATGGVAVGAQSFFGTLNSKLPVIDGVAVTPFDAVQKSTVVLFGDATHVLGPMGAYAKNVLHATTASVIYPDTPGLLPGAQAIQAALKSAGVSVTMEGYPVGATNLTSVLAAAHASTADMVVPYADATDCVNLAKALVAQGITNPTKIVSAPLCLSGTVIQALGDFPKWTYSIASSLYGDPTDPGMPAYMAVASKYTTPGDAPDPWNIVAFGEMLTVDKVLNQVGYANISPASVLAAAKAFKGPQALGAPALDCGQFANAPGVCNDRAQFFEYEGKNKFVKAAPWLTPVSNPTTS